ncbi:extracellular solute-binding protein [Alkalibacterium pelagium]|uniref:Iron(III) transport system substrate-binding protein n=1 Tax=Alkalibacterium pelagium TaxID=426702 RepID=A0A1H7HS61_9LACT|nr:extracellular solute-binding protein [Alkalibacterium pelagium]GEN50362.1 iron ABC transporter substrate-binding protein [Alkalibacterium pelagium]SEK53014.1 iron(III) transport system substrate-binding protein [Alkalibacterium pelagium]
MNKKMKWLLGICSATVLTLTACNNGGDVDGQAEETGDGNQSSDSLVIYSPNSEGLINATIPAFEEQYGVTVDLIQAGTGELFTKLESEKDAPVADIIFGGGYSQFSMSEHLFEEYVSEENDNVIDEYQNTSGLYTPYTLDGSVLVVNPDLVGDIEINSYEDLLHPDLKGQISSGDPANSSSAFAQLTNMLAAKGGYESDEAWDFVKDLYTNVDGKISSSSSNVYRAVADGEMAVGLSYEDPVAKLIGDGGNVEIVYPEEGVVFLPASAAIIKGSQNRENAERFIDFIISQEIQNVLSTTTTNRPVREDVETNDSMEAFGDINSIQEDMDYVSENREDIVRRYNDIFVEIESSR